ncbi:MAG: translation initiation factor IF-3 [Acidobacteria bacterium]|nr:translation initiation factor IF-3 [Acidobacteriota bacterium]
MTCKAIVNSKPGGGVLNKRKEKDSTRINDRIEASHVRLIRSDGSQAGIVTIHEALDIARNDGLDLVEVAANSEPPVCRVMNYGKYKFQLSKKLQDARKKQKTIQVKEVKFRPRIDEHDYQFKLKHINRFIEQGNKVRAFVHFRGREMAHKDIGLKILERIISEMGELVVVEKAPSMEGNQMAVILSANSSKK